MGVRDAGLAVLTAREVLLVDGRRDLLLLVIAESGQHQHVGSVDLNRLGQDPGLRVHAAVELLQHLRGGAAANLGMQGGDPDIARGLLHGRGGLQGLSPRQGLSRGRIEGGAARTPTTLDIAAGGVTAAGAACGSCGVRAGRSCHHQAGHKAAGEAAAQGSSGPQLRSLLAIGHGLHRSGAPRPCQPQDAAEANSYQGVIVERRDA